MLRPGRGGAGYGSPYPQAQSPYGAAGGYASPGGDYGGYNTNNNHNESNNNNNQGGGQSYGGYTGGNNAAYGGYSPPPPPSNGSFKDKKRKSKNSNAFLQSLRDPLTWVGLLAIVCFLVAVRFRFHETTFLKHAKAKSLTHALEVLRTATLERDTMRREYRTLQETHKASAATIQQHEEDKRKMLDHVHELEGQHSKHQHHQNNNNNNSEEVAVWKTQAKELKESIGREARRAASERFGPGPHFCQFALKFPDDPDGAPHRTFVVQLAPLGSMPHAVHLFLEQVSHKLWDGGWFYLNGPHVLQAGPQAEEEEVERAREAGLSQRAAAIRPFRELLLDSLSFAEYSDDFPHLPWTLGFTGRPGGPDFYINKVDNTVSHGPGGQVHHESSSEHADACFAKVVDGFDTLEKMIKSPIVHDDESEDYQYFFEDPVQIMSVTIVGNPFHHPDPKEDVSVMGETSTGSGSGPASQELLESLHDLREERHGGENVYHHEPARNDHHDETNPDRHRLHRMKHRPEFDHMVEP